jgi:hypothetical protein
MLGNGVWSTHTPSRSDLPSRSVLGFSSAEEDRATSIASFPKEQSWVRVLIIPMDWNLNLKSS